MVAVIAPVESKSGGFPEMSLMVERRALPG